MQNDHNLNTEDQGNWKKNIIEQIKKIAVKVDFQNDTFGKDMANKTDDLMQANNDLLKQVTAQKENLKLVASEALQLQNEFNK